MNTKTIINDAATALYNGLYAIGGMENGYETRLSYKDGNVSDLLLPQLPDSRKEIKSLYAVLESAFKAVEKKHNVKLRITPKHIEYGCFRHDLTVVLTKVPIGPLDATLKSYTFNAFADKHL